MTKGISPKMCILCVRVKITKRSFEPFCVWILPLYKLMSMGCGISCVNSVLLTMSGYTIHIIIIIYTLDKALFLAFTSNFNFSIGVKERSLTNFNTWVSTEQEINFVRRQSYAPSLKARLPWPQDIEYYSMFYSNSFINNWHRLLDEQEHFPEKSVSNDSELAKCTDSSISKLGCEKKVRDSWFTTNFERIFSRKQDKAIKKGIRQVFYN